MNEATRQVFGGTLRQFRTDARLSQHRLATRVPVSQATLSRYESGSQAPDAAMAARLDYLLDTGGELARLVVQERKQQFPNGSTENNATGSDDVNRRELLALGAVTALESARRELARTIGDPERSDLDEWEAIANEYSYSYLAIPPEKLIRQLSADLPTIKALIDTSSDRLRTGYCRAASQLAVITALTWSCQGEYRQAWRWWRTARALADASGDLAARMMCRGEEVVLGLYEHRPASVLLGLGAEAVEIGGDAPTRGTVALWAGLAQLHATTGRAADAAHALNRLDHLTEALPSSVTTAADSYYGWPEYRTRHTQSYVYTQLGDTGAAHAAQDRALALYPATSPKPRAQVELHRARCMVLDHDPRGGLTHATDVLSTLPDRFRRDAPVRSVARTVLDALPPTTRAAQPEALELLDALRC